MSASGRFPWPRIPEPAEGSKQTGYLDWSGPEGFGRAMSYIAVRGAGQGRSVVILAATGAAEGYSSLHGVLRLAAHLRAELVHGSVLVLPAVNLPQVAGYVLGLPGASDLDPLSARLHREILDPADGLIELVTAPLHQATASYVSRYETANHSLNRQTRALAEALGFSSILILPLSHDSSASAWMSRQGKPAVRVVTGDDAAARDQAVEAVFGGLVNGLRMFDILDGVPVRHACERIDLVGVATAPASGLWEPAVRVGQWIRVNDRLGTLYDAFGDNLGHLVATRSGLVLSYSRSVRVVAGETLVRLAGRAG